MRLVLRYHCLPVLVAWLVAWLMVPAAIVPGASSTAQAQDAATPVTPPSASRQPGAGRRHPDAVAPAPAQLAGRLPPDSTTAHTLELPGRTLPFKATAGSIPLTAADGHLTAEVAYVSYQLEGSDPLTRPVAFIFNGGPGSASAWTHVVGFGPWRLPVEGALSPSSPPTLVPNAETWLDFTDLVFIDPVGTGFSRMAKPAAQGGANTVAADGGGGGDSRNQGGARYFYSVEGDAVAMAETIAKWVRKFGRLASPKVLVGESYGGIRAPKVLARLQTEYGVGISHLVLISPVMDFGQYRGPRHRLPVFVNSLPTIAASAREANGQPFKSRDDQAEVEAYARGDYLEDLMRGPRDAAAVDRVVKRVAAYAMLPEAVVRTYGGKLDEFIYIREANRAAQRQASGYDTSVTGYDPEPNAYFPRWNDPFADALAAPITSAMLGLYEKLGWKTDLRYRLLSGDVNRAWRWGNSPSSVESISQLENALALDPKLRVLISHGALDLRTPYFGSVLLLDQLPAYADRPVGRVKLRLLAGGHMHYSRESSRKALRAEVQTLIDAAAARAK